MNITRRNFLGASALAGAAFLAPGCCCGGSCRCGGKKVGKLALQLYSLKDYIGGKKNVGLEKALAAIPALRDEFWHDVNVLGDAQSFNQNLEHAGRVADFLEFAEVLALDALHREESCGGHFRTEHQTEDGETLRDDDRFMYVAAWEYRGHEQPETMHKEELHYEHIKIQKRNYK